MYSIVWKYTINEKDRVEFEFEYGQNGTWSELFKQSPDYLGSSLHRSSEDNETYLLIDTWTDEQTYKSFMHNHKAMYEKLSAEFEKHYETEERIGGYTSLRAK